jgi:hypothetical protein
VSRNRQRQRRDYGPVWGPAVLVAVATVAAAIITGAAMIAAALISAWLG